MKTAMILVAFCFAVSASAATQYELTDMGNIGNGHIRITGMNNAGAVVGYVEHPSTTDAFIWQNGSFNILPGFGGGSPNIASAYGVNENGDVVGTARKHMWVPEENQYLDINRSVLWHNGTVTDLNVQFPNTQSPFDISSVAKGINDNGEIVGHGLGIGYDQQNNSTSFLVSPQFDSFPRPLAIDNGGIMVGGAYGGDFGTDFPEAFKIENGELELLLPRHSAETSQSIAHDINDQGQIVGIAGSPFNPHGKSFFWEGGVATIYLNTTLNSINNFGRAVGSGDDGAILLDSGQIFNLHDLLTEPTNMALYEANAINDLGWIAGVGEMPNGDRHAWLLKPVPEPTALMPLALMLLFRKR